VDKGSRFIIDIDNIILGKKTLEKHVALTISGGALILALIHILYPQLEIDEIIVILIIIAIIPLVCSFIEETRTPCWHKD
jgi:hypothetical protein